MVQMAVVVLTKTQLRSALSLCSDIVNITTKAEIIPFIMLAISDGKAGPWGTPECIT